VNLLVNSTEQRLARALLQLAQSSRKVGLIPKISQEFLAIMVGTTRSRTNFLMNQFRKRGFVRYNGGNKGTQLSAHHDTCLARRLAKPT